jgi:hypothetical protein
MIYGRVTRAGSRAPLSGANAILMSLDGRVLESVGSDESGTFAFKPVPAGSYRLRVRAIGYSPSLSTPFSIDASTTELARVSLRKDSMGIVCNLVVTGVTSDTGATSKSAAAPASVIPLPPAPSPTAVKLPPAKRPKG